MALFALVNAAKNSILFCRVGRAAMKKDRQTKNQFIREILMKGYFWVVQGLRA
jgi:hypothetical protein